MPGPRRRRRSRPEERQARRSRDFERLDGRDPLRVETPTATTPSGGLQLYFSAAKPYKNKVAIDGTGIDTRTAGGYVILPAGGNGRRWLRRLSTTPLQPAPDWLDCATKQEPPNSLFHRRTLGVAPSVVLQGRTCLGELFSCARSASS